MGFFSETRSFYIVLDVLELTVDQALNSQRSTSLYLPSAGIKACTTMPGSLTNFLTIVWFCISFSNIKFLLINWEFHIIHPNYTHFPIFPGQPPPTFVSDLRPPTPPEKKKKSSICDAHILNWHGSAPSDSPLKKTESLPISASARMLHLSILIIIFKSSLQWLLSRLLLFGGVGRCQLSKTLFISLWVSTVSLQSLRACVFTYKVSHLIFLVHCATYPHPQC